MTADVPQSLAEWCNRSHPTPDWCVDLVQSQIGGGRLAREALAALERAPNATAVVVSGLDQDTFEALVAVHGARLRAIHLWKCPRIADLAPLQGMANLAFVAIYWNQRATRLWDLRRTPRLRGLACHDFSRWRNLADLQTATSLEELQFGDMVWSKAGFDTLEPLGSLPQLRHLTFNAKRIADGRIQPLSRLVGLATLDFPPGQFTTQQIAWLRARLPETVQGRSLGALFRPEVALSKACAGLGDALPVGKRQRFLDSRKHAARIARHVAAFEAMVREFREHPEREPE